MPSNANTILKLALAVAALLAGGGVGFYYGVFLPAQDLRRQTREMEERRAQSEARDRALAERAQRLKAAEAEYQGCIGFAEQSYKERWTLSCQSLNAADQAALEDCADDLFGSREGCLADRPVRPAQDCALPHQIADQLTAARDTRKAECLARLQAVQGGPAN